MADRKPNAIAEAGLERVGPARLKHYRDVRTGEELSYRQAFSRAHGRSLEASVHISGKFAPEHNLAKAVREAARSGALSKARVLSKSDEAAIGKASLRSLTRGHYESTATKRGLKGKGPERSTPYSKAVLAVLQRKGGNSPTGKKARLLVAIGRRDAEADYDVGETPD